MNIFSKLSILIFVLLVSIFHFGCRSKYAAIEGTVFDIATLKPIGHATVIAQAQTEIKEEKGFAFHKIATSANGHLAISNLLPNRYYQIHGGTDLYFCRPANFLTPEINQTKLIDTLFALKPTVTDIIKSVTVIQIEISSSDNSDNTSYVAGFVKSKLEKEKIANFIIYKEGKDLLRVFIENYNKNYNEFAIEIDNDMTSITRIRTLQFQSGLSTPINNPPGSAKYYLFRGTPSGIDSLYRVIGKQMVYNGAKRIIAIKLPKDFGIFSNSVMDDNQLSNMRKYGELIAISTLSLL